VFGKLGSKAVQGRMGCGDGEAHQHRKHCDRCRRSMPDTWPCRGRPPGRSTRDIEVPSQVCWAYFTYVSLSDVKQKSDLDGIEGALKLCAETSMIKRVLLRADMLQKVRKYDSKLSNVLQTFHVRPDLSSLCRCHSNIYVFSRPSSLLDARFAQIVDKREVG
jgi:hypothetical protein